MHGFTGAIDAAIAIQEAVDRSRCLTTLDAAIGEIERRRGHVEERKVGSTGFRRDEGRCEAALAFAQGAIEARIPAGIGGRLPENFVILSHKFDNDIGDRCCGRQTAHERVHAIVAGEDADAEIGHDEPLIGALALIVLALGRHARRDRIDARLQVGDRLGDRERGGHVGVQLILHREFARIHLAAEPVLHLLEIVARHLALEVAGMQRLGQAPVADAVDFDGEHIGVDRHQRHALLAGSRQHIGTPGRTHRWRAVLDIDVKVGRL